MTEHAPTHDERPASRIDRRSLLQLTGAGAGVLAASAFAAGPAAAQSASDWDKTFPKSDKVDHRKVNFTNRYGIALTGDLYLPKDATGPLPALAVAGPFGAVKEQSSGLYAQTMAERGFATMAFDPSYTGESQAVGWPVASPDINTEDFGAAIDFLGLLPQVDRARLGIIGICGFGGMALNAVAVDKRVKAVAVASMYDMSRVMARGYYDAMTPDQRRAALEQMSAQRWTDAETGAPALAGGLPETLDGIDDPVIRMYHAYYKTPRGFHERSVNSTTGWTVTNALSFMNMPLLTYIAEVSPRPMLLIAGENAHSRYFSEDAFATAAEPKELLIIAGADHVDLYDRTDVIPFDRLQAFFDQHLA
ncbi:alpha/beta hydrolase [Paracoccus aestuariivivens]|uniref:Alpha/beta hydrolase n=1 Tax=Paracoccus aestuariivivens TaxID=1820333 RepID=A0A6L6JCU9_9RHOB|nr:alpha/beta hydrolase [Paracoccus aestuariivivens]MTH78487.1 alpha/beta hydrolase [Paracoccus aestuariivivens]